MRWAILATVAVLAVGGCAMYLSWVVFVAYSSLTLVGSAVPALMLLPRTVMTHMLIKQAASCALWFMFIGWSLVALLYPECAVGWTFPGKCGGGLRVLDVDDAWPASWVVVSLVVAAAVLVLTVEIIPRIRGTRSKK